MNERKQVLKNLTAVLIDEVGKDSEAVTFNRLLEKSPLDISDNGYALSADKKTVESFDFEVNGTEYGYDTFDEAKSNLKTLETMLG